jgi:hypothetical protein
MLNKIDVYTVMLALSLFAVLVGIGLLAMERGRYGNQAPPAASLRHDTNVSQVAFASIAGHGHTLQV